MLGRSGLAGGFSPPSLSRNGQIFDLPDAYDVHMAGKDADAQAVTDQVTEFDLPGKPGWEYEE